MHGVPNYNATQKAYFILPESSAVVEYTPFVPDATSWRSLRRNYSMIAFTKRFLCPRNHCSHIRELSFYDNGGSRRQLLTEALKWFLYIDQSARVLLGLTDSFKCNCKWKPCASAVIFRRFVTRQLQAEEFSKLTSQVNIVFNLCFTIYFPRGRSMNSRLNNP